MSNRPAAGTIRRRLIFSGYVQGVGFRYWARRSAENYAVGGCVRNLPDGDVEVVVEGPVDEVERFVALLRGGPPRSRVTDIRVVEERPRGEPVGFLVQF